MLDNATLYINETKIKENTRILRTNLNDESKIIAVIKANGYGCDLVQSALLCERMGIDVLAVLSIDQAIELRKAGVKAPILLLGVTLHSNFKYLLEYDVIQAAVNYQYALDLAEFAKGQRKNIKVHIKVDTGLNRLGLKYHELDHIQSIFSMEGLDVEGIYSHFVASQSYDKDDLDFSKLQIERFNAVLDHLIISGINPRMTHMQNTPSILNFGDLGYSAVRCGMVLFGLFHPSQLEESKSMGYESVIEMRLRIAMIKEIKEGEYVGYGREFQAKKDMTIATISSGYVDGIMKTFTKSGGQVIVNGTKCSILGDIAMSQFMVDVTDVVCKPEDEVVLFGTDDQTIYDYIKHTGQTINELISHIRYSIPRIYVK
ncbi:alanine racemase [Erysipelothrix urinaevulpis]|uniref:alanine racemase n=1 Tax=Erysipelothrix urinaevulpis TaxID=2683717 RepID=UPI0013580D0D|nr:alanine racemase [Erysipelothrix urinaevulpis]